MGDSICQYLLMLCLIFGRRVLDEEECLRSRAVHGGATGGHERPPGQCGTGLSTTNMRADYVRALHVSANGCSTDVRANADEVQATSLSSSPDVRADRWAVRVLSAPMQA